jgi:hypothetical protein
LNSLPSQVVEFADGVVVDVALLIVVVVVVTEGVVGVR